MCLHFFVILLAVIIRADKSYQRLEVGLEFSHNLPMLWNDAYFPDGISERSVIKLLSFVLKIYLGT